MKKNEDSSMFRKQGIIALLGLIVVAAWPMASEAIQCSDGYGHVSSGTGGSSGHTCVRLRTGSFLLEALTAYHPGKATLTIFLPQGRTGPKRGGDDDNATTTSTMSTTEPPVEALLVCRTEKSTSLVKIPASFPKFSNTDPSNTVARSDHPGLFMGEHPGIRFKTTLSANPTPAQLLMLTRFCPGCANEKGKPVNYLPLHIRATLAFETGDAMFDLNAKAGNCTVNFADLTVDPTGEFNRISYGGGCAPALGNESPYKEPPPTRHGEPKAKSRHQ